MYKDCISLLLTLFTYICRCVIILHRMKGVFLMRKFVRVMLILLIVFMVSGCKPDTEINPEDQLVTISQVYETVVGEEKRIEGTVIEYTDEGILLLDSSGTIYVHVGDEHLFTIGDNLGITFTMESVDETIKFDLIEISVISLGDYTEARTPETVTSDEIEGKITEYTVGEYLRVIGECSVDGETDVISFSDNDAIVTITQNKRESWSCTEGTDVAVWGYILFTPNDSTLNIMYSAHEEVEITFDVMESLSINVGNNIAVDWTNYIMNPTSNVSDSFTFEVEDLVIYDALGEYSVNITVIDEFGCKASKTITVYVEDPDVLLHNGDFSQGISRWSFTEGTNSGGAGTFTVENEEGVVEVISPIAEGWGPRLESNVIVFEQGETYEVSFRVKSDDERTIGVQLGELLDLEPWFVDYLGVRYVVDVNEYWQTVYFEFTMYHPTGEGQLLFNMGELTSYSNLTNYETTVYFDDVEIRKYDITKNPPEFYNIFDTTVLVGQGHDPIEWIFVFDYEDGDLTDQIVQTGEYDLTTPGEYTLTFSVTDSHGNVAEETMVLTVVQPDTISAALDGTVGETYTVLGTVVAIKSNGFLIRDDTGSIYVYTGGYPGTYMGDIVSVTGATSTYGGAVQFDTDAEYYFLDYTFYVEERTPVIHDGASIEVIRYDFEPGAYIQFTGTVSVDGNYVNVIVDGTTATGSLYPYEFDMNLEQYDGQEVTVTGYLLYFNGDEGQYMNVIAVSVEVVQE